MEGKGCSGWQKRSAVFNNFSHDRYSDPIVCFCYTSYIIGMLINKSFTIYKNKIEKKYILDFSAKYLSRGFVDIACRCVPISRTGFFAWEQYIIGPICSSHLLSERGKSIICSNQDDQVRSWEFSNAFPSYQEM